MKIVVLAGGTSTERDVSLVTGSKVYEALLEKGHDVVLLDPFMGYVHDDWQKVFDREDGKANVGRDLTSAAAMKTPVCDIKTEGTSEHKDDKKIDSAAPDLEQIKKLRSGKGFFGSHAIDICQLCDIVFMALHGANGEDGRVQAMLDLCEIKYTGSNPLGAAVSMDKGISKQLFRECRVPTPAGITVRKGRPINREDMPGFPMVVKACNSGSSVGVYIVNDETEFDRALNDAFTFDDSVVIEQYIKGREFSVGVIEGKALPIIEIAPISGFYDYKNKYQAGSTVETCPAELPEEKTKQIQRFAELAFEALHIDSYARIDVMMSSDGSPYLLEANTLPGMTPTSLLPQEAAAIGVDFPSLCQWLIEVSLRKWEDGTK